MARPDDDVATDVGELARLVGAQLGTPTADPHLVRPCDKLLLLGQQHPSDHLAQVYDPVVCLVVQGAKETRTADRVHRAGAGQFLVVTHDVPVTSRITEASREKPYRAIILSLDSEVLHELHDHAAALPDLGGDDQHAVRVGTADRQLIDAFGRCLEALGSAADRAVLFPLASREIHYRLLATPSGQVLRRLSLGDRPVETVARAIRRIRDDLTAKISVGAIAGEVGLSTSALHHHFKQVTGTTPVQFQKQLRLLEGRRLIGSGARSVTEAAFQVGYASPTQFSREYRRTFGHPPSEERARVISI